MLVGRQAERQAIDRLMASARLGTSGVLALTGEAGVGKTALLDDAIEASTEMRVLRATGLESEREIPFATLLQLLRPALPALDGIPGMQAEALAAALALPSPAGRQPGGDQFAIGAAVLSLICRYAEDGPVAVVVDDLQLADSPSANSLVFAARRLAADPVVVLLAARSPEGDAVVEGLPSLHLEGLDLESARALLAHAQGGRTSEERLMRLHRATDGNPLALLELGAEDREVVDSVESGMPFRVPRAIVEAFGQRLAQVDAEVRAALLAAAVCGTDLRLIGDTCDALGVDVERLGDAEDLGLVTLHSGRVEFRHPLLRAAVYSGAPVQDRRATHHAAAGALPRSDVDRRAWHLSEALWHPDAAAAELMEEAGEHALARAAYSVAAGAFERSARLTPDDATGRARVLRAADAAWTAGLGARALELLDDHRREAPPGDRGDVRALELRAAIAARTGSLREALDILLAAADATLAEAKDRVDDATVLLGTLAEAADRADDATVLLADAVHATFYLGDARTASSLADRLSGLRSRLSSPRARALGLMATGMARILAGRGGADDIRTAVPLLESDPELHNDPRRLSWLMLAPLYLRDASGGARLRTLVDEVRGAAGVGALPALLFHVARDQAAGAAWARAEANYTESIRLAAETGQTTERAMSLAGLCWLESHAGKAEASRIHAEEARAVCAARDIHIGETWVDFALGDLELSLGRADVAVEHFETLTARLDRLGLEDADLSPAPELVDALVRLGRRPEALAVAESYRERAVAKGQPWARARADRACGQAAASDDEFEGWFGSALEWHVQTLDRFEAARTRLAYGERIRRAGRRVDARVQLRAAVDEFSELGAVVWRDRAAVELTATGEHVRAGTANAIADLTPQELQVSLLLAEGSTTREAAAALFLSPKTVEYHLRKVYTKLGIGTRAELARLLAEDGAR